MQAAADGDPDAMESVAFGFLRGTDGKQDFAQSAHWFRQLAETGNSTACYNIGLFYARGCGVAENKIRAAQYYAMGAQKGYAPSQWNLACCYMTGQSADFDRSKAITWAYKSADQGHQPAIDGIERNGLSIKSLIAHYKDPMNQVVLEATQYEGRADRCERLTAGKTLTARRVKNSSFDESAIELFYLGGSVGYMSVWASRDLAPLLDMGRITIDVTVKSCIPKSARGARARNADVKLKVRITEKKPETPEEREQRLAREQAERLEREKAAAEAEAQREARRKEEEEARRQAEERRKIEEAEAARKKQEERRQTENKIRSDRDAALRKIDEEINHLAAERNIADRTLASLGLFKFSEKQRQKAIIENATARLNALNRERTETQQRFDAMLENIGLADKYGITLVNDTTTQRENYMVSIAICKFIDKQNRACLISEMMAAIPEAKDFTNMRFSAVIRNMVNAGILERNEYAYKAYFSLPKPKVEKPAPAPVSAP